MGEGDVKLEGGFGNYTLVTEVYVHSKDAKFWNLNNYKHGTVFRGIENPFQIKLTNVAKLEKDQ